MKPIDCKTESQVCELQESYKEIKEFSILLEATEITLTEQAIGEPKISCITIPKRTFDKFVEWYQKDQPMRKEGA